MDIWNEIAMENQRLHWYDEYYDRYGNDDEDEDEDEFDEEPVFCCICGKLLAYPDDSFYLEGDEEKLVCDDCAYNNYTDDEIDFKTGNCTHNKN